MSGKQTILSLSPKKLVAVMPVAKRKASSMNGLDTPYEKKTSNYKGGLGEKADADELSGSYKDTPYANLLDTLKIAKTRNDQVSVQNVVYWMRMKDMRVEDNRALARASKLARENQGHLIVLHVLSPQDYDKHDRSSKRIDFVLRNLKDLKAQLESMHIPLVIETVEKRKMIPKQVIQMCKTWRASHLFGNIEKETDELDRDTITISTGLEEGVAVHFGQDVLVVPPNDITTNDGRPYAVYSPWLKKWTALVSGNAKYLEEAPMPSANDVAIRGDLPTLFGSNVPDSVHGFECEDAAHMKQLYPSGHHTASAILDRFLERKHSMEMGLDKSPLACDGGIVDAKNARVRTYAEGRNMLDNDNTSRLSPYLAAGVISARECIRRINSINGGKLTTERGSGLGVWCQEVAWRDFYGHVLAAFPRVCKGKAFQSKFDDVVWNKDEEVFQRWCEGKTGYPIVDAGMRQLNTMGYMHNRCRMIVAMFLTKDLLVDWRKGERYFMKNLIDGDFASNNGGWQWSASTGTDPQPYFRIFNPYSQSEKSDISGDYIRTWVPELAKLKGKAIHEPGKHLVPSDFKKLGYPKPIVNHAEARITALRRFKDPGVE